MWQKMETAPKDGTRFLATDGEEVAGTYWRDFFKEWACETVVTDDGYGAVFHGEWFREPIAWQPLPPPPSEGEMK